MKPNQLEVLEHVDLPLEKAMEELMDGDILVFQRDEPDLHHYDLPTAKEYFKCVESCTCGGGGGGCRGAVNSSDYCVKFWWEFMFCMSVTETCTTESR